jgi:hypothetical protein
MTPSDSMKKTENRTICVVRASASGISIMRLNFIGGYNMDNQDSTAEILEHKRKVEYWARDFIHLIESRVRLHDNSKLLPPEKEIFDEYTPKLKEMTFGSDEYKAALVGMGEGLKHHYKINRHHPEHFENGVNGMTLYDLVEMFCDWLAAAEAKHTPIRLSHKSLQFVYAACGHSAKHNARSGFLERS